MADTGLNPNLPYKSPGHGIMASNMPFLTIPLERNKVNCFSNSSSLCVGILRWLSN